MPSALPLLCLAYCLGIFLGDAICLSPAGGRLAIGLAGGALLLALRRGRALGTTLLALSLALGLAAQARRPKELPLSAVPIGAAVLAEGTVQAAPELGAAGVALRVSVAWLQPEPGGDFLAVSPPALVSLTVRGALHEPLWPGDRVRLRAALRPPEGLHNPGAPDPRRRAAAEGAQAMASVEPDAILRLSGASAGASTKGLIARLRAELLSQIHARLQREGAFAAQPEAASLVAALALGARGDLATQPLIEDSFRRAGIYHVLSVSGLHLAVASLLFYGGLLALLRRAPPLCRRIAVRRLAALCAIPATLFYTELTGAAVATVRAAGVAVLCYGAIACGRRARLAEALAAALLWILGPLGTPLALFDPSLQLSVAAVLGTAWLRPRLHLGPAADTIGRAARAGVAACGATLGATLATAPLCALHFGAFEGAGLLGNLIVVPLGELLVLPAGLFGALLSLASPAIGGPLLDIAAAGAIAMAQLAAQIAGLGLSATVAAPGTLPLCLWAVGLLGLSRGARLGPLLLAAALGLHLAPQVLPQRSLTATFLDIGQGDATVLALPGGPVIVIDGGAASGGYDPGERVILPHLRRHGVRRIDLLVLSHPHPDHSGGLASLLEQIPVGALWTSEVDRPATAAAAEPLDATYARLLAVARERGVPIERPRPLRLGPVRLDVLSPPPAPDRGHNDNSLVLRVEYAGQALLFSGDLELRGELRLLEHQDLRPDGARQLRAAVLKVPHHCSKTSSSESLLREVAPLLAVCSLGRRNRYGFPHAEVLERYRALGIPLWRTDQRGAVTVRISHKGEIGVESVLGSSHAHDPADPPPVPGLQ